MYKTRQKFGFEKKPKDQKQTSFKHAFKSMLWIRFFADAF